MFDISSAKPMRDYFGAFDARRVPSPCFVIDKVAIEDNLKILNRVQRQSGAKVLAALKAFSCTHFGDLFSQYLSGVCASGLYEAKLGREYFCAGGGEVHTYSPAFRDDEFDQVLELSNHVVFNSPSQWLRHRAKALAAKQQRPELEFGLRINPEHSEGDVDLYDPCAPCSRMGTPLASLEQAIEQTPDFLQGLSGFHFHTLCEQDFQPLARTLVAVESKFGHYLAAMSWINFGGGHHISREDYQVNELIAAIKRISDTYSLQVYLEPGEAVAIRSGVLVAEVLDLINNHKDLAILDTSATCHMPDTLEMPYRADIYGAGLPEEKEHRYRLGGMTCLSGDVIGDYSFDLPLEIGQRLMFADMSHYTMVKTTTFNGLNLPSIAVWDSQTDELNVIKQFGYDDFRSRLG